MTGFVTGVAQDLRYGVRTLRKTPGFTAISLATLALGIGANTAIFSFVNGVLLKPLPYADANRIVRVLEKPPLGERNGISTLNFLDWRNQNTVFEHMAAMTGGEATLTGSANPFNCARDTSRRPTLTSSECARRWGEPSPPTRASRARTMSWS